MSSAKTSTAEFLKCEIAKKTVKSEKDDEEEESNFTVYIVTWNVGSRFPDNITLTNLLSLENNNNVEGGGEILAEKLPDIYAIGLQEVNTEPQQQVRGLFKEDPWNKKLTALLAKYNYVNIKVEQMQGLLLILYCRRQHVAHLCDMEAEFTRTGFGGIWGNKGAVSIRLNVYGVSLVFVCSHLAAHDHHLEERVEDYKQIMEKHHYHVPHFTQIYHHDYVWWFGDLNFRLEGDDTAEEIRDAVFRGELQQLLARDQLTSVRNTGQAFQLLKEDPPTFPPTFKFKEGTNDYELKRRPAWTDRILFVCQLKKHYADIKRHSYRSHPAYTISDHKPVSSDFSIKIFPKYRTPSVIFCHIDIWFMDKENVVEYTKPAGFEERKHDWIGLYAIGYTNLRDHLGYEYVSQSDSSSSSHSEHELAPPLVDLQTVNEHKHRRAHPPRHHTHIQRVRQEEEEKVRLDFGDNLELKHGHYYKLIYFQSTGIRGVTSIAGMSNEFMAQERRRTPSPRS